MHRILVWTQQIDVHADLVIRELLARDTAVTRVNGDDFPAQKHLALNLPDGTATIDGKEVLDHNNPFDAVWYRRRGKPTLESGLSPEAARFATDETTALLDGLLLLSSNSFWVNSFASAHVARNKSLQLALAARCGLEVPPTLISNDPSAVKQFAAAHEKIIYKPVHHGLISHVDQQDELIFTNVISRSVLEGADAEIQTAPGIYQAYVPKQLELRITIVGDQLFSCAIHSQEHETTREDWRHYHPDLKHSAFLLPDDISQKLLAFMRGMNLVFGTVDMVLTPDDRFVFLEVNQMGQWAWIQYATGMPIAQTLADLLLQKGGTTHEEDPATSRLSVSHYRELADSCG